MLLVGDKTIKTSIEAARAASFTISNIASAYPMNDDFGGTNVVERLTREAEAVTFQLDDIAR